MIETMAKKEEIQAAVQEAAEMVQDAVQGAAEKVQKVAKAVEEVAENVSKVVEKVAPKANIITPKMAKIPEGPLEKKWTNYKDHQKLVNPANKRKLDVIVVGTGLAGASAAASPVARTLSQHRVVSMLPRITRTTVTPYIVFTTTPSRVATIALARLTYIVWLRSATISSTSA